MKTEFLMIILTALEGGGMSVAFVNTPTLEECEGRARAVETILEDQNIAIEKIVCRQSEARFEPFVHGAETEGERHGYVVSFDGRNAWVVPGDPDQPCEAPDASASARYCATSSQKQISQEQ